jgi:hypothetical protein
MITVEHEIYKRIKLLGKNIYKLFYTNYKILNKVRVHLEKHI